MSRKRTLYVSELLKRNYNTEITIVITINTKVLTFYNKEEVLTLPDINDKQVIQWSFTNTKYTKTLHIVLK